MEKYGIKNITKHEWNFEYDKHYRQVALKLKEAKTENERNAIKDFEEKELSNKQNSFSCAYAMTLYFFDIQKVIILLLF